VLISCEKCATTYVLDERLIPAAGAPVQCTRCSHVFIARPGAGAVENPTPAPAVPQPTQTMQFGTPPLPQAAPTHQTMMFGAAPVTSAAPQTMMFGTQNANANPPPAAAPPAAPAAAPRPNSTMMFGALGSAPAANQGPVPTPAAAARPNQTMMFGAGGTPAAPAAAAPKPNQTMMFGAAGSPGAPTPPAAAPQRGNATMIFGGPGAPGGPPAPAAAKPPPPAAPAPAQQSNRTMMFGVPTAEKPNVEPRTEKTTMMFGAQEALNNPGKLTERTVRIGPEDLERMKREHGGGNMTPPETDAVEPVRHQKTQMFAMKDIEAPAEVTPNEGSAAVGPPETREQVEARHNKTAMFAMTPEAPPQKQATPMFDNSSPLERSNVKLDPSLLETFPPDGGALPLPPPNLGGAASRTMIFGGAPGAPNPMEQQTTAPDLIGTTLPNLPPLNRVELPPEPDAAAAETVEAFADPALALRSQVKRRNRLAAGIVIFALMIAAAAVGWKVLGPKLFGAKVPLEAMQGVENGLAELRKDDSASKANAVKSLTAIVKAQPTFVDAHAALVTALTLQLDDLQQRAKRLEKAAEERNLKIGKYNLEKGADWETRANALSAEVTALKKDYDPLVATARDLEVKLREAYKAMQTSAQAQGGDLNRQGELALIRAQALFHAYGGTDEALKLSKRYQAKSEGSSDGWIDLVDAEYAANTRASPELIASAQKALTALHERDPTFFRTYILAARLDYAAKAYDEAEGELERVTAMKPQHDIANELIAWIKKVKKEKPAAP
jgi:predicted Zn finger-like uncharacterized protein